MSNLKLVSLTVWSYNHLAPNNFWGYVTLATPPFPINFKRSCPDW